MRIVHVNITNHHQHGSRTAAGKGSPAPKNYAQSTKNTQATPVEKVQETTKNNAPTYQHPEPHPARPETATTDSTRQAQRGAGQTQGVFEAVSERYWDSPDVSGFAGRINNFKSRAAIDTYRAYQWMDKRDQIAETFGFRASV